MSTNQNDLDDIDSILYPRPKPPPTEEQVAKLKAVCDAFDAHVAVCAQCSRAMTPKEDGDWDYNDCCADGRQLAVPTLMQPDEF